MWTHDGVWHRYDAGSHAIIVLENSPPSFDVAVDVEVSAAGRRWSATFVTPEQIRECLDRWVITGEALPGNYFGVDDSVIVSELSLESIRAAVADHFDLEAKMLRPPFAVLDDEEA